MVGMLSTNSFQNDWLSFLEYFDKQAPFIYPIYLLIIKLNEFSVVVVKGISLGTTFKITCWECYLINSVFIEIKSTWKVLESSLLLGG